MEKRQLTIYQVDAFTDEVLNGNPAAIIPLEKFLDEDLMLKIAVENNLSETAYIVKNPQEDSDYDIRWFTPGGEVGLCGHATQASSYIIFNKLDFDKDVIRFSSKGGILKVSKKDDIITLDFPAQQLKKLGKEEQDYKTLVKALEVKEEDIVEIIQSLDYIVVLKSQELIDNNKPNLLLLKDVGQRGVAVTSENQDSEKFDIISRFYFPKLNINEDTCCGSGHCCLVPYWLNVLGKNVIRSLQVNRTNDRESKLICEQNQDRVILSGKAALYMEGTIFV